MIKKIKKTCHGFDEKCEIILNESKYLEVIT